VYDMDLKRFALQNPLHPLAEDSPRENTQRTPSTEDSAFPRAYGEHTPQNTQRTNSTENTVGESASPRARGAEIAPVAGVLLDELSAVMLARQLCRAGRIMHEAGLVHRDIKPKNCMLSGGRAVIIDFGFSDYGGGKDRVCVAQVLSVVRICPL
jgi:eukaryotic-like serine/threonine-protein kinase